MDQVQCNKNYRRCSLERMFVLTVCLSMSWSDRDGAHLIDHVFQNVFCCTNFDTREFTPGFVNVVTGPDLD